MYKHDSNQHTLMNWGFALILFEEEDSVFVYRIRLKAPEGEIL